MAEIQQEQQHTLRILAVGDSLTAGYYDYGRSYHPYTIFLSDLFSKVNIPVKVDEKGVSGERVVPTMVNRLGRLLKPDVSYDWIIILGGTNDLCDEVSAEIIFKQGLEPMYEMCLNHSQAKTKLAVMTVMENSYDIPTEDDDKDRQALNSMIRNFVAKTKDQDRVCLVDLDKDIRYHSDTNDEERQRIWDDSTHLKPAGYDRIGTLVFNAIKSRL